MLWCRCTVLSSAAGIRRIRRTHYIRLYIRTIRQDDDVTKFMYPLNNDWGLGRKHLQSRFMQIPEEDPPPPSPPHPRVPPTPESPSMSASLSSAFICARFKIHFLDQLSIPVHQSISSASPRPRGGGGPGVHSASGLWRDCAARLECTLVYTRE